MNIEGLGVTGAIVIIVGVFLKFLLDVSRMFAAALDKNTQSNQAVAEATVKAAREAAERNGHLAELSLQGQQMLKEVGERNYKAIKELNKQNVKEQVVQHQTVENKE